MILTPFQWISLICILAIAYAGGYYPLFRRERAQQAHGFPLGQAFTAGVFLALSLTIMLPAGFSLFNKAFPDAIYPIASLIALVTFLSLLALEHMTIHMEESDQVEPVTLSSPMIPVIMTLMIALPSFFLGAALGVSDNNAAIMIFIAIIVHKGSAGFALALKLVRSTLTRNQTFVIFSLFAFATPFGIVVGEDLHRYLAGHTLFVVKGTILSLASGTFMYMGTTHEMRHTPLIKDCGSKEGFLLLLAGFVLTALVRLIIGEAHHL